MSGRSLRINDKYGAVGGEVVRVDLTMWRRGDPSDVEKMGWIEITNAGPTSDEEGRDFGGERFYDYRMNGADGVTMSGRVRHCRRDGALGLLAAVFDDEAQVDV